MRTANILSKPCRQSAIVLWRKLRIQPRMKTRSSSKNIPFSIFAAKELLRLMTAGKKRRRREEEKKRRREEEKRRIKSLHCQMFLLCAVSSNTLFLFSSSLLPPSSRSPQSVLSIIQKNSNLPCSLTA